MANDRRRSADTRAAILDVARARFASEGFQTATVRAIASDAGIDPALVMRYFGSKSHLLMEALDVDLRLPDLHDVPVDQHGPLLVEHFLSRWDSTTPDGQALLTLLRSASDDPTIAGRLRELFATQLVPALAPVIADPQEVLPRVGLIASQMLGVALTRSILRLPPVVEMEARFLSRTVGETVRRYLYDPLPDS